MNHPQFRKKMEHSPTSHDDDFLGGLKLEQIVDFARRHMIVIAGGAIIGAAAGIGAALMVPQEWQARSVIQVGQIARANHDSVEVVPVESVARTAERLRLSQFQDDVLRRLGLSESRYESKSTALVRDYASIEMVRNTDLIAISARGFSDDEAKRIVQAYQDQLIAAHKILLQPSIDRGNAELQQARAALAQLVKQREGLANAYASRPPNADAKFSQNVLLQQLTDFNDSNIRTVQQRIEALQESLSDTRTFNTRPLMGSVEVGDRPVFPRKSVFAGLGALAGFVLGCCIGWARSAMSRAART